MRILWLTNSKLPELSQLRGEENHFSGGWLIDSSKRLSGVTGIELSIAYPVVKKEKPGRITGKSITYYSFNAIANKILREQDINVYLPQFLEIIDKVKPDVVHIHGSELPHSLVMSIACKMRKVRTILSIQGLVSKIKDHIDANLPQSVINGQTIRNIIRRDSVKGLKKLYENLGVNEVRTIRNVDSIIGRTFWDKSCITQIDSTKKYISLNESLRESFYEHEWRYENCTQETIFLSQAHYPLKGIHVVLQALRIVKDQFPNVRLIVSGKNIYKNEKFKHKITSSYYSNYINKVILDNGLRQNISFVGPLSEIDMCEQFLKSNVYVCSSSIENSPNSLCEAMILGVPCVASYVGGIPDLLSHEEEGLLYQSDAPYMLASNICKLFEDKYLREKLTKNARKRAFVAHNRDVNFMELYNYYYSTANTGSD